MEFFTSPSWNPQWIWGIGIILLGIIWAGVTLFERRRSAASNALRDQATKRRYEEQNREDEARQHR